MKTNENKRGGIKKEQGMFSKNICKKKNTAVKEF